MCSCALESVPHQEENQERGEGDDTEMKVRLYKLAALCLVSGLCVVFFAFMLGLWDLVFWFWFGSAVPIYTFGYSDFLDEFKNWIAKTPPFKGWRYWIEKTLHMERVK